jgi:hypothetical protein
MSNNNVVDINVNSNEPHRLLGDAQLEVHMRAWSDAVGNNDYLGVIAALNTYAAELEAVEVGAGIVSVPAFIEMQDMLRHAMPDSRRVCYHPTKGWYDGGEFGENIGAPLSD